MKYELRFKPRALKDLKRLPANLEEALASYEDLQVLREAKAEEGGSPTLSLDEVKAQLGLH